MSRGVGDAHVQVHAQQGSGFVRDAACSGGGGAAIGSSGRGCRFRGGGGGGWEEGGDVVVCEEVGVEGVAEVGGGAREDVLDWSPDWAGIGGWKGAGGVVEGDRGMRMRWLGLRVLFAGAPGVG